MKLERKVLNHQVGSEEETKMTLFEDTNEWEGMPEFIQEKKEAYSKIIVRFDNEDDLQEFAKMIGQKLTNKTKSIWHPKLVRGINSNKRYKNES